MGIDKNNSNKDSFKIIENEKLYIEDSSDIKVDTEKKDESPHEYRSVKKICPKCGFPYGDKDYKCPKCSHVFISTNKGIDNSFFWFLFGLLLPFVAVFFVLKVKKQSDSTYQSYRRGLIYGSILYFCIIVAVSIYISQGGPKWFA